MYKSDAIEAAEILRRMLDKLMAATPTSGRAGSDLRSLAVRLQVAAPVVLQNDVAGQPIAECLEFARASNMTLKQIDYVRKSVAMETPLLVGAIMVKSMIIAMILATEGRIIADMIFTSREQVDQVKAAINAMFAEAIESAADDMDAMSYRRLSELHGAIIFHLIETARPLPRMLAFRFAAPLPTLIVAYKLYDDAGRADELRAENRVVHPAFAPRIGRALSA